VIHVEHVMGMAVSIEVRDLDQGDAAGAVADVCDWLHWVDSVFSTYQPDSAVSRLADGRLALADAPLVVADVLAACSAVSARTGGYFDAWAGGRLDPSGYVKGWSVEAASALLAGRGSRWHSVNAGGDARVRGTWTVGIAHPHVRDAVCALVEVHDGAVATSGTAERGAHVIDPHTGRAALDLASVTVLGPDLTMADVYATAALAMGLDAPAWLSKLAASEGYNSVVVDAGGYLWTSLETEEGRADVEGGQMESGGGGGAGGGGSGWRVRLLPLHLEARA
jgi:thiamine biosynthesis lipoprotein